MAGLSRRRDGLALTRGDAPALVVRTAEARDVARVAEIELASFADPWTAESFRTSLTLDHMRFLVAVRDDGPTGAGQVVGYVLAMVLGPEAEIADIAVAPESRGAGTGGLLLDEVTQRLRALGVRTIYLEVRESNEAARRLYESRGFGHVGRRRGYYQLPAEDALVMRREYVIT